MTKESDATTAELSLSADSKRDEWLAYLSEHGRSQADGWEAGWNAALRAAAQPAISAERVEALTVELFERSHEPSFTDDCAGMAKARQCAISFLRTAGLTVAGVE